MKEDIVGLIMRNECRLEKKKEWADMEKLMRAMKEMTERVIRSETNSHREAETKSKKKEVRVRERGTCVVHIKWLD